MKGKISIGVGALLVIVSALIMGGVLPSLAIVTYETPSLSLMPNFPSGSESQPTPLGVGNTVILLCYISMLDVGNPTTTTVRITGASIDTIVALVWTHRTDYDQMAKSWTVPNLAQETTLRFYWYVATSGNYTADATTFGKIGVPNGKFYINGEEATLTSIHQVTNPNLQFKFVASNLGNKIQIVNLYVTGTQAVTVPMTETVADTEWTGSYTLPSRGQYEINGFINDGTNTFRLMSIFVGWGETTPISSTASRLSVENIRQPSLFSLALMTLGIVLIAVGIYWEKES